MQVDKTSRFEKSFDKLSSSIQRRAVKQIILFQRNPQHPSLRTHKLKGRLEGLYSLSVSKNYRVIFIYIGKKKVLLLDIGTHEIYG